MPPLVLEWLNLVLRWAHVIAAIMWVGDSFLFMWMDRGLEPPSRPRGGAVAGELWMVHSGGFYEVVKRTHLAPAEMPRHLHWFKWEAYTTWISGFFLMGVVYFASGGVYLLDRGAPGIGTGVAVVLSLALLAAAWLLYDALWRSPLARRPRLAGLVCFALIAGAAFGLTRVYSGRGAFLQLGAMLGTVMAANVWRVIIPAQSTMVAATRAGTPVDVSLGARAKTRSTHNHYLTLPVLMTMLASHFPTAYGSPYNGLVLVLLVAVGASAKVVMNDGRRSNRWVVLAGIAALVTVFTLTARGSLPAAAGAGFEGSPPVSFQTANDILQRRCVTCHAARPSNPSFPGPPAGVTLEDPRRIRSLAPRIMVRAVITKTMPLGNLTGMTDEERQTLGAWIAQGARIDGAPSPGGRPAPRPH